MLDGAGFPHATIVASGGLDEYEICRLRRHGAPIGVYGVGTRMGVSADAPYLDSAYKLVAYGDRPVMKLSPRKISPPGPKQVFRSGTDRLTGDLVAARDESPPPGHEALLVPVMVAGRRLDGEGAGGDLDAARRRFEGDLSRLPPDSRLLRGPATIPVSLTERLAVSRMPSPPTSAAARTRGRFDRRLPA